MRRHYGSIEARHALCGRKGFVCYQRPDPRPVESQGGRDKEIRRIYSAAEHAVAVGIKISAGHGLDYKNIMPVLKTRALEEVHVGRSIATRSDRVGLSKTVKAVKEMLEIVD